MSNHQHNLSYKNVIPFLLVFVVTFAMTGMHQSVEAKKKEDSAAVAEAAKKAADEAVAKAAEAASAILQKNLKPLSILLDELLMKSQSRYLFSPDDSSKLADAKFKLRDIMKDNPQSPLLARPVYQAGMLCFLRDQYEDAYELFSFLTANFPTDSYGLRAKAEIQQMKKKLGADYFNDMPVEQAPAVPPASGKPSVSSKS